MNTIQTPGNKITEEKATDLMFTGFRQAVRAKMTYTQVNGGPEVYGIDVNQIPDNQVGGFKQWSLRLYSNGELIATGFADEHDL